MAKYHAKLKGVETLDGAFAVLSQEYAPGALLPQQFVQTFATLAPTWQEGLEAIVQCSKSHVMHADEEMLRRLIVKTARVADMLEVTAAFRAAFPNAVFNARILRVCLGRVRVTKDPYALLERLKQDLKVEPDDFAHVITLIRLLKSPVLDEQKTAQIRSLIARLERSNFGVVSRIKNGKNLGFGMDPHHAMFLYMRYLFLERRHQEALQLVPLVLRAKGLSPRAQRAVAAMVNMFLPADHPYRVAIAGAVPSYGERNAQENAFHEAFRAWLAEDDRVSHVRFDGGNVFKSGTNTRPVDRNAVREFFKEPRE